MKRVLQRLLIGSLAVLMVLGSYSTHALARNYTELQMIEILAEQGFRSDPRYLDWDDDDSYFIILNMDGDPFSHELLFTQPPPEVTEGVPIDIRGDLKIKSDDSGLHSVVVTGPRMGWKGYVTVKVKGTERALRCAQWDSDLFLFDCDDATGVFDKVENSPRFSETLTWHYYYAKDKVKPASAPETTEVNEYRVIPQSGSTPEKWEITLPFDEENKLPLFKGTAVLYDWNQVEISRTEYAAKADKVSFSGTDFSRIIPGFTYYVQTIPAQGIDCDDEGFVYQSYGTRGAMMPFALGCLGSDYVDRENSFDNFEINYGYKDKNEGYEPALKWNGKVDTDSSLLIKPLNTEKDWIIENIDEGTGISDITLDSFDEGARVLIDNTLSSNASRIIKKSENVNLTYQDGTLLAKTGDKEYLASGYDPSLSQELTASVTGKSTTSISFKLGPSGNWKSDSLEVPAVATLTDVDNKEVNLYLPAGTKDFEFTGLAPGRRYYLSLRIDNSEKYMPTGCNGIKSIKGDKTILYGVSLDKLLEASTLADKVTGVSQTVLINGNIRITNESDFKIRYVISDRPDWKEGDPALQTGTVGHGKEHTESGIVKQDDRKVYYIYYKYDDEIVDMTSEYAPAREVIVDALLTVRANWKVDISGLKETAGNDFYIRSALKDSANAIIVETKAEFWGADLDIYVIEESKYTGDEDLMKPENKVGITTVFDPGTYIAIVGLNLTDSAAADMGYKVIRNSVTAKFTVYAGNVPGVKVSVKPNGNIRINNPTNIKIEYKIVAKPDWKEGNPEKSGGTVDRDSEHTDTNVVKTDKGQTYYIFYRFNDTEKNVISKDWTLHPYEVYINELQTIKAEWKTDISGHEETYSEDEKSLRSMLEDAGEARISETGEVFYDTGVFVYAVNEKDYTTDEALMAEVNKVTDASNYDVGTYVAIVGLDITDEEAFEQGYRVVRKSEKKKFTVKPATLTLEILPETRTVWNATQDLRKSDWTVAAKEDDDLEVVGSSYTLSYTDGSVSGEITEAVTHFSDEAEYILSIAPVSAETGFTVKRGDKVLNNANYEVDSSATARLFVSRIDDGSFLEARKNAYTDKLYYDDLKGFTSNEELKPYLDAYLNGERKLDQGDYKLVVDHSATGSVADLAPNYKMVGASFDVSVHPIVDGLPLKAGKNTITLTVSKQPVIITAAEPDKLHHFVGDNPKSAYSGTISVNKLDIYDKVGDDITFRYGNGIANWAASDAVSVDLGYINPNKPGKYEIELKDITKTDSLITLNDTVDENYSLVKGVGEYTIDRGLIVSLYDVATGKELAVPRIISSGSEDIIFETTNKGEPTMYADWYIRDLDGEGEKLSWPHSLGFGMEGYNETGLRIKRIALPATELYGNLRVYGRFPSDKSRSGDTEGFHASDITPVIYNGNKFVAEFDTKYLNSSGAVKNGYTMQLHFAVYDNNDPLTYGVDYTLSYKNNLKAAKADAGKKAPTVTIKGIGAYKGKTVQKTFTILPADLSALAEVKLKNEYIRYNGKEMNKIVKGDVLYSVGSKRGKKLAKKSYAFRVFDLSGTEVTNTVMPKTSEYTYYRVEAVATEKDPNFEGETLDVSFTALPANSKGKLKITGVKKSLDYKADGVAATDYIDPGKFKVTAGTTEIKDINDPRIAIDIVSEPLAEAFAIERLVNSGSYYLRVKPSQFNTFAPENIFEPCYVKISFKGTDVKNLVKLKNTKFTWDGGYHSLELKMSNKAYKPEDVLIYRRSLERDALGLKQEVYIRNLREFADQGIIPGGALENADAGTYVLTMIGVGSCFGEGSVSYVVNPGKYSKSAVTAYINTGKKQEDMELDFNRAGYSDDLVKVYWTDPSDRNAEPVLLTLNKDYEVIWGENDKVGRNQGSVTIVGKNTYFSKRFKKVFTINKTDINSVHYVPEYSSALLGSGKADPYLCQIRAFDNGESGETAALIQGTDYKVTNIVEDAITGTATATIDASDSKYFSGTIKSITYDLYPVEVTGVRLTLDRTTVLLYDDYAYHTEYDVFDNKYLSNFVEGNIQVTKAEIEFKDKPSITLTGDEIAATFKIGYFNADKTGNNARVMAMFRDGRQYPTGEVYFSDSYSLMVKP